MAGLPGASPAKASAKAAAKGKCLLDIFRSSQLLRIVAAMSCSPAVPI
jgi:hypothetical protein